MRDIKIFGDTASFAIRCARNEPPRPRTLNNYCHWVLHGKLIGVKREPCHLGIWTTALGSFRLWRLPRILSSTAHVTPETVHTIFNLPSDQWNEEVIEIWRIHKITLDETQDAWLMMAHKEKTGLRFIWQGWREPCPTNDIGRTFTVWADVTTVIEAIDGCLSFLKLNG